MTDTNRTDVEMSERWVENNDGKWEVERPSAPSDVTQGGVPTDLDADVEAWEALPEFVTWSDEKKHAFIDRLIAERKALREEVERLRKGMTLEELLAHHGLPSPDVTDNDRAEFRVESVVAAIAERDSLQAENAKLCDYQVAAAEERIELRERLNDMTAALLNFGKHDTACDIEPGAPNTCNCGLQAALTESQEEPSDA